MSGCCALSADKVSGCCALSADKVSGCCALSADKVSGCCALSADKVSVCCALSANSPDEHIPEVGKLAVPLVLNFNEPPLGLTAKRLLSSHHHCVVTANHRKRNKLLRKDRGRNLATQADRQSL